MDFHKSLLWSFIVLLSIVFNTKVNDTLYVNSHVIQNVQTTRKVVALTIDDGPHYKTTPKILQTLKEKQVRATFFVLGVNVETSPELLSKEIEAGHEIGNHGYSHTPLTSMTKENIEKEVKNTENLITSATTKPVLFRPPGGAYNAKTARVLQNLGYSIVMWNVDPHDWARPSVDEVVNSVLTNVIPGSIILMHDGQYPLPTAAAIALIIDKLRNQGYEFVTVSELLKYNEMVSARSFTYFDLQK